MTRLTPVKMMQAVRVRPTIISVAPRPIKTQPTAGGGGAEPELLNAPDTNAAPIPRYNSGNIEKIAINPP